MAKRQVTIRNTNDLQEIKDFIDSDGVAKSSNQAAEYAIQSWAMLLRGEFDRYFNSVAAARMVSMFGTVGFEVLGTGALSVAPDENGRLVFVLDGEEVYTTDFDIDLAVVAEELGKVKDGLERGLELKDRMGRVGTVH